MKSKSIITLAAILFFIPLSANARGFGGAGLNINLNDVMVSQRTQDMSQRLRDYDFNSMPEPKKEHHRRNKKHEDQKMACIQKADTEQAATTDAGSAVSSSTTLSN